MVLFVLSYACFINTFIAAMIYHLLTAMLAIDYHYKRITDIISDNDAVSSGWGVAEWAAMYGNVSSLSK